MRGRLARIFWLGLKEILSLRRDVAMSLLLVWAFSAAVYMDATGKTGSVNNVSVAVVDEDRSALSRALVAGLRPPEFQPPVEIAARDADALMDGGEFLFVISIPPRFEADLIAGLATGRGPQIQVLVDATAMEQAGLGAGYIQRILGEEIARFAAGREAQAAQAIRLVTRSAFNPNRDPVQFQGVTSLIGHITILSVILAGAALIREREHGTLEHLLAMPLSPFEIAAAKIWANGAVVLGATTLSMLLLVEGALGVEVAGSRLLFLAGTVVYLFSTTALGMALA
ncbi:MAG: ABC transporter permease, partial [Albimonas sp.]|uniref:ABC transporter permease n=1 Tax=Albimonas sp. TaxID=1872425 RepID=UPI0040576E31